MAAGGVSLATLTLGSSGGAQGAPTEQSATGEPPPDAAGATAQGPLTAAESRAFGAIAERILPSSPGSPGAKELGVMTFVTSWIGGRGSDALPPIRAGLAEVQRLVGERHRGTASFAALTPTQQDALLRELERAQPSKARNDAERERLEARATLFEIALGMTATGAFAHPKYGGNRAKGGWALLGFTDRHSWAPPFGEVDRA